MENWELVERFLPGYRLVCRLFARYLAFDLTNTMTILFVLIAVFESARYVIDDTSSILTSWFTSSIVVCEDAEGVYWELMRWVSEGDGTGMIGVRALRVGSVKGNEESSGELIAKGGARR